MIHTPRKRTPTSGVIVEVLYLAAVALSGGLSAWAIQRATRPEARPAEKAPREGAPLPKPSERTE